MFWVTLLSFTQTNVGYFSLLNNTNNNNNNIVGDFVRANGLQEGDFIGIYSDIKYGKYVRRSLFINFTNAWLI